MAELLGSLLALVGLASTATGFLTSGVLVSGFLVLQREAVRLAWGKKNKMKHEQDIRPLVPPKPEELEGWQERARALLEGNFEKPSRGSGIDTRDMFYIPTINLYFSKQRTHDKETWNKAWEALANEKVLIPNIGERALRMPTIEEFRKALIYFKNSPN